MNCQRNQPVTKNDMKNYIVIYRTWSGVTGEVLEKATTFWAANEDDAWEESCDSFSCHNIVGIAEIH